MAARVAHFIPLQSIKIIIVAWQILTQVRATLNGPKLRMNAHSVWTCRSRRGMSYSLHVA